MRDYIKELVELIQSNISKEELLKSISQYHESDIADAFLELSDEELVKMYDILPPEMLADVITYIEEPAEYLELMDNEDVAEILDNMESNDAAEIIEQLDEEDVEEINALVEPETLEDITLVSSYSDEEVGSIMSTDYIEIKESFTIKEAMRLVISSANEVENINVIYVVDDSSKYVGIISLRDLIRARSTDLLSEIIKTNYPVLKDTDLIDELDKDLLDYELESYAVLDSESKLIGIVNDETLVEILEEDLKEDYAMLAGIADVDSIDEPVFKSAIKRLPWLVLLLFIGLLVSLLTSSFEGVIAGVPTIVFFQSVILGMAGNTGTQSLAVTISTINDDKKGIGRVFARELFTGFLNGVIVGLVGFLLVFTILTILQDPADICLKTAFAVAISLICSMSVAAFLGSFVPFALTKLKVDPAIASGPFITTINDIVAICIYYGLATLLFAAML